jgi:hypothetical protein
MDEALTRAFTDAYLRYETTFAQFTTSNNAAAAEADQRARYREFADAQQAFLEAAHRLARDLLEQSEDQTAPPPAPELEPDHQPDRTDPPDEPQEAPDLSPLDQEPIIPELSPEPDEPQEQDVSTRRARAGLFRFGRSR